MVSPNRWDLIRVNWDKVDRQRAHLSGTYPIQLYRPHFQDAPSRAPVDCRYIADVQEWLPRSNISVRRDILPTKRAAAFQRNSNLSWPTHDLQLAEHLIHGPFDFSKLVPPAYGDPGPLENWRIANSYWCVLEDRASKFGIDVSNIRTIPASNS